MLTKFLLSTCTLLAHLEAQYCEVSRAHCYAQTNSHTAHVTTRVLHHLMLFQVTRRATATKPSSRLPYCSGGGTAQPCHMVANGLQLHSNFAAASQSTTLKGTQLHTMSTCCWPSKLANSVGNKMTCHPRAPGAQSHFTLAHIQWLNHLHACESEDSAYERHACKLNRDKQLFFDSAKSCTRQRIHLAASPSQPCC